MSAGITDNDTHRTLRHTGLDVEVAGVSKRFGGALALDNVSVTLKSGTVHALVGENGAGKSTLGKIISGVLTPDEGEVRLNGEPTTLHSPREGLAHGIVTIAQELAIVPGLSVEENVFLGITANRAGFVRRRESRRRFNELADQAGFHLSPGALAGSLRTADQQKVEIMRALSRNAALLIMDEPTGALSGGEAEALYEVIRSLASNGQTVVLISHFLSEVLALSDTITTLRDGRLISTVAAKDATENSLIEGMLGRSLGAAFPEKHQIDSDTKVVLSIDHLCAPQVTEASLTVAAGEIVGIAGLVGSGRSELARAIFRDTKVSKGIVLLEGQELKGHSPHTSIQRGLSFIPESRKEMGLLVGRSVKENITLSRLDKVSRFGWISKSKEREVVTGLMGRVKVKAASMKVPASSLSGGNQQKLLFARIALCEPSILIADEPTRGVDVGSKRAIYDMLVELAQSGMGIIVISSDLEEVLGISHRILVMRLGRIVADLRGEQMNQQSVLEAAFSEPSSVIGEEV